MGGAEYCEPVAARQHHRFITPPGGRTGQSGRLLTQCHHRHTILPVIPPDKSLVWLHGEVKSPPFSPAGRHSRPMPSIGARCHELRVVDAAVTWRIVYRIDADAIVIAAVFKRKTARTPAAVIDTRKRRLKELDHA